MRYRTLRHRSRRPRVVLGALVAVAVAGLPSVAYAAPNLSAAPITWDVIGLDSNKVNTGPNTFPVGARLCNNGSAATGVTATLTWDTSNPYIALTGPATVNVKDLATSDCADVYFQAEVQRTSSAYFTSRGYHITVASGTSTASTPSGRELYVEKLISQNRNGNDRIDGPTTVFVGGTYTFTYESKTATKGYEQFQNFLTLDPAIFRIASISTSYTAPTGGTNDKWYADACGWAPTTRTCVGPANFTGGKVGGTIRNTVTVTVVGAGSTTVDGVVYDKSGSSYHYNADHGTKALSVTSIAAKPDLEITKTVKPQGGNPGDLVNVGGNVDYTLTVKNVGSGTASPNVTIKDPLPAGLTFVSASGSGATGGLWSPCSNVGQNVTCVYGGSLPVYDGTAATTLTVTVRATASAAGAYTNTATAEITNGGVPVAEDTTSNNSASSSFSTGSADVAFSKVLLSPSSGPYYVGTPFTYRLTATNNGNLSTTAKPVVTDTLPLGLVYQSGSAGCTYAMPKVSCELSNLAPGQSAYADVVVLPTIAGDITNSGGVTVRTIDPTPANNTGSSSVTGIKDNADMSITKTAQTAGPYVVGQDVTFALAVTNKGPGSVTSPVVTDTLPSGMTFVSASSGCSASGQTVTCNLAPMLNWDTATLTVTARVNAAGTYTNSASVKAELPDTVSSNDTSTASITVPAATSSQTPSTPSNGAGSTSPQPVNLVVRIPTVISPPEPIDMVVDLNNKGAATISDITVRISLPVQLVVTGQPTKTRLAGSTLVVNVGKLAPKGKRSVKVRLRSKPNARGNLRVTTRVSGPNVRTVTVTKVVRVKPAATNPRSRPAVTG